MRRIRAPSTWIISRGEDHARYSYPETRAFTRKGLAQLAQIPRSKRFHSVGRSIDKVLSLAFQSSMPSWLESRRRRVWHLAICAVLVASAGVACGVADEDALRARAAFDFKCPQSHIKIINLDGADTYGVIACGQRATYINDCRGRFEDDCTWVLDSDSHRNHLDNDDDDN